MNYGFNPIVANGAMVRQSHTPRIKDGACGNAKMATLPKGTFDFHNCKFLPNPIKITGKISDTIFLSG